MIVRQNDDINVLNTSNRWTLLGLAPRFGFSRWTSSCQIAVIIRFLGTLLFPQAGSSPSFCLNFFCSVSASWHNRKPLSKQSMKLSAVISRPDQGTHKESKELSNKFNRLMLVFKLMCSIKKYNLFSILSQSKLNLMQRYWLPEMARLIVLGFRCWV